MDTVDTRQYKGGNNRVYKVGIYRRLSKEDVRKGRLESESIENQLTICRNYIAGQENMIEVAVYTDDGFTGLNYERKGFRQMMRDVKAGKIDTILTKSLSRLGREHAETIQLFKKDFVNLKVRYIAVSDNIDFYGMIENMELPLKVILNDLSSMETSKNVRSAFKAKKEKGAFTGSFAPYGYQKDPNNHNHLIPDEEAAEVVRFIFQTYLNGTGIADICLILNRKEVLPPAEYKNSKGFRYSQVSQKIQSIWTYPTVRGMLSNETYIGKVVQNRDNKLSYNSSKKIRLPKSEWIIVENMHEPLVSVKDFEMVQTILKEHWRTGEGIKEDVTKYRGMLKCGDCGRSMSKARRTTGMIFRCGSYARFGREICSSHWIKENDLDRIVLEEINKVISGAVDREKLLKKKEQSRKKMEYLINKEQKSYKNAILTLEKRRERMILHLSNNVITEEDFNLFAEHYTEEKGSLEEKISDLQYNFNNGIIYQNEFENRVDSFLQEKGITKLTREILINLVSEIRFFETEDELRIVISFRFRNPLYHQL